MNLTILMVIIGSICAFITILTCFKYYVSKSEQAGEIALIFGGCGLLAYVLIVPVRHYFNN